MFEQNDEENTQDVDLENENNEEELEEEGLDGEDTDSEDESEDSEDDSKPITKKDLQEFFKKQNKKQENSSNAARRVLNKKALPDKNPKIGDRLNRIESAVNNIGLLERKRSFGYENNLSPKEVDYVFRINPKPTRKFLDDPFIKGGLETLRTHQKVRDNTPSGTGRTFAADGKSFAELKPEEKEKNMSSYRRSILDSKKAR